MSSRIAVASIALLTVVAIAAGPASAAPGASAPRATCGFPPGQGAYSFYETKNVSCKVAQKINRKAGNRFCSQSGNCDEPVTGGFDKGRVNVDGWRCKMKVGYEFFQARCKKGGARFKYQSAA